MEHMMTDDQQVAPVRDRPHGGHARARLPEHSAQAALIALGIGVAVESVSLGFWTRLGPGPGLLPLLLGVTLVGLAAIWAVQSLLAARAATARDDSARVDSAQDDGAEPLDLRYIAVVIGSLIALAALLDLIGFQIAMALFLLLHLRWIGRRGWLLSIGLALAGSVGTFVLFDRVLQVPLPLSALPLLSDWGL
jgi:putative tricarboxylic transport membrane protein